MKQVQIFGPGDLRLEDVPEPEPGPRDVVLRVAACGICGSDVRYARLGGLAGPSDRPMPIGHELTGVVAAVGADVSNLTPGTRVVLNPMGQDNRIGNGGREGGFAPYLLVRNAADGGALFPIPDELPDHLAALAEPLGVGMNAVDHAEAKPGDRVAVFGAGPIGLAAVAYLRDRGVDDVVAIDLSARRLEIATALGATTVIDASGDDPWPRLRTLHGEEPVLGTPMAGTDAYIEASGASPVISQVLQHAKRGARLSVVALHYEPIPVSFLVVMMKELTIRGAMEYPDDFSSAVALLGRRDLSPMVTHRFALADFHEALATACDPQAGGKVVVDCG